jgi:hypothetical protein
MMVDIVTIYPQQSKTVPFSYSKTEIIHSRSRCSRIYLEIHQNIHSNVTRNPPTSLPSMLPIVRL